MKEKLLNYLLSFISIALTLVFLEFFFNHYLIHKTPLKFHFALPEALQVLAQSSKDKRLPNDYIALVGDSYAQGKGDWLLQTNPNQNSAFHSAHLIHQYLGQDVVSFGNSGSSNIEGLIQEPIAKLGFIERNIDTDIQNPKQILVYFYAGNDLTDNLEELTSFVSEYGQDKRHNQAAWHAYFKQKIKTKKVGAMHFYDANHGWLIHTLRKLIAHSFNKPQDSEIDRLAEPDNNKLVTSAWIAGKKQRLPNSLQTPAMALNQEQTQAALDIFKRCLIYMQQYFKQANISVVYIPAVLESYSISSSANIALNSQSLPAQVTQRSDQIAAAIKAISIQQSLNFIDTRPAIQQAAKQQIIHGPRDWKHFNQAGYKALSQAIVCSEPFKVSLLEEYKNLCM
ncbi:MAG: hypothetical protein GQ582_08300 [Methyloprofundus sp.]|nr:hypothetical protein [Methyloprofundus sp.]